MCMAIAAASSVTPRPPRKSQVLPLASVTTLITDNPAIRNSQLAPRFRAAVVAALAAALAVGSGSGAVDGDKPRLLIECCSSPENAAGIMHAKQNVWLENIFGEFLAEECLLCGNHRGALPVLDWDFSRCPDRFAVRPLADFLRPPHQHFDLARKVQ